MRAASKPHSLRTTSPSPRRAHVTCMHALACLHEGVAWPHLAVDCVFFAQAFKDTGFVNDPVVYMGDDDAVPFGYNEHGVDLGLASFAKVSARMHACLQR